MKKLSTFLSHLIKNCFQSRMTDASVAVAYYLLLTFFPLLLVLANLLPLIKVTPRAILTYLSVLIPENIYQLVEPVSKQLLVPHNTGVLFLSLAATFWPAGRGMTAIKKAFQRIESTETTNNRLHNRIFSTALVGLLVAAVLFVTIGFNIALVVLQLVEKWDRNPLIQRLQFLISLRWSFILVALFVIFTVIYYFVPTKKLTILQTLPGTITVTFGWFSLTRLFENYAQVFIRAGSYQVLGSFILLMIWLVVSSLLIIFGGILNLTLATCFSPLTTEKESSKDP